jgi:hypothetical protein
MVDASIWDKEIEVPEDVISFVDSNVIASKPCGFLALGELFLFPPHAPLLFFFFFSCFGRPICGVGD